MLTAASQCHPALLPLSDLLQRRNLCAQWGFSVSNPMPPSHSPASNQRAPPTTAWAKVGRTKPNS